ncbi:MAG: transglycosylase domain-containing protein [Verrucomicrobium sp.]|nr:transglycosylase domain-containing protein [Verrucomicrobium sp.]
MRPSLLHSFWIALGILFSLVAGAVFLWLVYSAGWALCFNLKKVSHMPLTTVIYDRNGHPLQRIFQENRVIVSGDQVSHYLKDAIVATEDQRFYRHVGVDPISMGRAAAGNLFHGHVSSGASTITQQLARNSAHMSQRTYGRKLKEIFLALRLESVYTKEQILTFYMNRIFFGGRLYGVGSASEAYFGKAPKDLTLSEAAMLAGIISGPNSFSPWHNPAKAKAARARALRRMEDHGYITEAERRAAEEEPLALRPLEPSVGSHAGAAAWREAQDLLSPGLLSRGGLRIETTIDLGFQREAEAEVERQLEQIEAESDYRHLTRARAIQAGREGAPYLQGAFVALDNRDGGILALVGSRNYDESHFDRALAAWRQIGSTVKPFVYANAFNVLNIGGMTQVDRSHFDLRRPDWATAGLNPDPANPPDFIPVRQALETSDNFASVRTAVAGGLENFADLFRRATGVTIPPYPSSALGACSVTPLQVAAAFSIFPNYGIKKKPYLIRRILDPEGRVLYEHVPSEQRVLSPQVAFQVNDLLQGVVDEGTGRGVRAAGVQGAVGGKTGTTNDYKDSWFVGYTTAVTAGLWIGFDTPVQILPGGYASRLSVPLWGRIMAQAQTYYPPGTFEPPPGVALVQTYTTRDTFFGSEQVPNGRAEYLRAEQRDAGGPLLAIGGAPADRVLPATAVGEEAPGAEKAARARAVATSVPAQPVAAGPDVPEPRIFTWLRDQYHRFTAPAAPSTGGDETISVSAAEATPPPRAQLVAPPPSAGEAAAAAVEPAEPVERAQPVGGAEPVEAAQPVEPVRAATPVAPRAEPVQRALPVGSPQ